MLLYTKLETFQKLENFNISKKFGGRPRSRGTIFEMRHETCSFLDIYKICLKHILMDWRILVINLFLVLDFKNYEIIKLSKNTHCTSEGFLISKVQKSHDFWIFNDYDTEVLIDEMIFSARVWISTYYIYIWNELKKARKALYLLYCWIEWIIDLSKILEYFCVLFGYIDMRRNIQPMRCLKKKSS